MSLDPTPALFGTRHAAHEGIDVCTVALDFVDVQTTQSDAVVADAHDDDARSSSVVPSALVPVQWTSAKRMSPSTADRRTQAWKSDMASSSADQLARTCSTSPRLRMVPS
jgi:hypothetical protein